MNNEINNDILHKKLQNKLKEKQGKRTGTTLKEARSMVSKTEKNKMTREIRKQGVKALTKKLGITDPDTEQMVFDMIKTGQANNPEELIKRIAERNEEKKQKEIRLAQAEAAKKLATEKVPEKMMETSAESHIVSSLPSANPNRNMLKKSLKPPSRPVPTDFDKWMGNDRNIASNINQQQ